MLSLFLLALPITSFAAKPEFEINSKQELKEELKSLHKAGNKEGIKNLKEQTDPSVMEAYLVDLEKEISTAIEKNKKEMKWSPADNEKVQETVIPLSDGGQVIITEEVGLVESQPETVQGDSGEISTSELYYYWNGASTYYKVTKNVVHYMYPDTKLVLRTFFKVNTSNITITDADVAGTQAYYPNVATGSASITDKYASELGHDANAKGTYNYSINAFGADIYTTTKSIVSSVKWYKTRSGGKDVNLTYSFY